MSDEALIKNTFDKYDKDKSGEIEVIELKNLYAELGVTLSDEQIAAQMRYFDENSDGKISFAEFIAKVKVTTSGN